MRCLHLPIYSSSRLNQLNSNIGKVVGHYARLIHSYSCYCMRSERAPYPNYPMIYTCFHNSRSNFAISISMLSGF